MEDGLQLLQQQTTFTPEDLMRFITGFGNDSAHIDLGLYADRKLLAYIKATAVNSQTLPCTEKTPEQFELAALGKLAFSFENELDLSFDSTFEHWHQQR